ncbi:hypothetical protein Pint_17052 [Pistacia integerrima]|uniref:Uncharacterized protein n=1 Tax=Pistacia integerrima TaxID=434235 RepID=A0ACC0ZC14_9ROSI|nr:hypothetical protein Pint_17052 [Pistacia integerrima]
MVGLVGFGCVMCVCRSSGRSVGWACGVMCVVVPFFCSGMRSCGSCWLLRSGWEKSLLLFVELISLDEKKKQLPKKFLRRTNKLGKMHCKWSANNGEAIVHRSWNEWMDGGGSLGHWNEN